MVHSFVTSRVVYCNYRSWRLRQRMSQTSCKGFRMLYRVWSQEPRNTSVVFHGCCAVICTGWLLHSGHIFSLPWLFIGVFCTELLGTSASVACQSPKFPTANISVRPAVANWIFRGFVATHLAHAGFLGRKINKQYETCFDSCGKEGK